MSGLRTNISVLVNILDVPVTPNCQSIVLTWLAGLLSGPGVEVEAEPEHGIIRIRRLPVENPHIDTHSAFPEYKKPS